MTHTAEDINLQIVPTHPRPSQSDTKEQIVNFLSRIKRLGNTDELLFGRGKGINTKIKKRLEGLTLGNISSLNVVAGDNWTLRGGHASL